MAEVSEKEREEHIARNGAGEQIGVTCLNCNRYMEGKEPRLCGDCSRQERAAHRSVSSASDDDKDKSKDS